jgi:chromosomal replication initiation ATPase DnaA
MHVIEIHRRRIEFMAKIEEKARLLQQQKIEPVKKIDGLDRQLMNMPEWVFDRPKWKLLAKEICKKHNLPIDEVLSDRQHRHLVKARQEIWYRIRIDLGMSYPEIGKRFNRDHSTIMHGVKAHIERLGLEFPE